MTTMDFARSLALTERVWRRQRVRRFGSDLQRMANRKLLIIDAAEALNDLRVPLGNRLEQLRVTAPVSTAYGSTINGGFASPGQRPARLTSRSPTTTEEGRTT
jgi:plasmid maintenance system killer protein